MLSLRPADRYPSTADALNAVLTAPGYSPDARPLVELMRTLFAPQPVPVLRTVPMDLPDPAPVPRAAAQVPTVELARPLRADATGASYVSDRSSALRAYARPARSPVGRVVLMGAVLGVGAVGAGVGLRRLVARAASASAVRPDQPVAPPPVVAAPPPADVPTPAETPPPIEPPPSEPPSSAAAPGPAPVVGRPLGPPESEPKNDEAGKATLPAAKALIPAQLRAPAVPGPSAPLGPQTPPVPMPASLSAAPVLTPAPLEMPPAPSRAPRREKQRNGNVPNAAPILE